jgi:hypothetical protein
MAEAIFLVAWHQLLPKLFFKATGSLLLGLNRSIFQETFSGNGIFQKKLLGTGYSYNPE